MYSAFETFVKTIKIGERLFSLSYSDYQDAYDYSQKYHAHISDHMIDFFINHSSAKSGEYEYDLIRYIFIKAMEQRISSDLYSQTSRGNVCDIFHSPFDIVLPCYPTNLPKHLEDIVNDYQKEGHALSQSILEIMYTDKEYVFGSEVLNALQFIGQTIGYHVGQDNRTYKKFNCSDMLTRNEINEIAGNNVCKWMINNSYEIEEANFTRDTYQNIVATKNGERVFVLISAEIAPTDPGFIQIDLDNLYNASKGTGATPYYASISLGSADENHFAEGVILYSDQIRFKVNAFGPLELE